MIYERVIQLACMRELINRNAFLFQDEQNPTPSAFPFVSKLGLALAGLSVERGGAPRGDPSQLLMQTKTPLLDVLALPWDFGSSLLLLWPAVGSIETPGELGRLWNQTGVLEICNLFLCGFKGF